jgi:hypothetical protein
MEIKINLSNTEHKDLISYCNLNDLLVSSVVKDSFTTGFNIERYGLLNVNQEVKEKEVIKEVIKYVEIPVVEEKEVIRIEYVEVPVEKVVTKEVIVEKIVEVIKEIPSTPTEIKVIEYVDREVIKEVKVEVPVEKIVYIYDKKEEEVVTNLDNICDKPEPEIKEVIIEKIVEVIKEVEKIVEVPVEVIREVIVEKEVGVVDKSKLDALQSTIQKIRSENLEKDRLIKEYEKTIQEIQEFKDGKRAVYLSGSNLNKTL